MRKVISIMTGLFLCLLLILPVSAEEAVSPFDDPYYSQQWALEAIDWLPVWRQGLTGKGVKIGIIDSGAYAEHEDLQEANLQGANFIGEDEETFADDQIGHGTFVTGIIAADPNNGKGIVGIAPDAEIYAYRAFSGNEGSVLTVLDALAQALADGCQIINLSMGTPKNSQKLFAGIQKAQEAGVLVIAAVGNGNYGITTTLYPAGYEGVIGVGSVNQQLERSSFSQTNESVFVMAPGQELTSLSNADPTGYVSGKTGSGTSYAAPIVTALAALALEYDPNLTPAEIAEMLRLTATDLGETGYDTSYGYGLVNAAALIEGLQSHFSVRYQLRCGVFSEDIPLFYPVEEGLPQLPLPACQGHIFIGWYADEGYTEPVEQIAAGATGAQTLYAKWEADGQGLCRDEADDGDHLCDICDAQNTSSCEDVDRDHACDECDLAMGNHEAAEGTHICDYCGETVSTCIDSEDLDTQCDICGQNLLQIRVEDGSLIVENAANVQLILAEYDVCGKLTSVQIVTEGAKVPIRGQIRVFTLDKNYIPQLPWLEVDAGSTAVQADISGIITEGVLS